jgi:hypothetical protein
VVTTERQGRVDTFDTSLIRVRAAGVDVTNIKRLSQAEFGPRVAFLEDMSTTIEATPKSGARTDRQAENCRRLAHKVAVITGGSTGMGLATAKRFVQEGMDHVFITGRRKDVLDVAVAEIGDKTTGIPGDVANLSDLDRLYESVKGYGRKIDVVFANAGIAHLAPFGTVDEKFYDLHFDANVKGLFFAVQKALPLINDGGAIVLTASIASVRGSRGFSVYSATKAATSLALNSPSMAAWPKSDGTQRKDATS